MPKIKQSHKVRSLWLSVVIITALVAGRASAQDDFCGMPDEVSNLLAYSPIVKQGNFKDFLTTNNLARSKMIGSLGELSSNLIHTPIAHYHYGGGSGRVANSLNISKLRHTHCRFNRR